LTAGAAATIGRGPIVAALLGQRRAESAIDSLYSTDKFYQFDRSPVAP
jgi:hypothetical protein